MPRERHSPLDTVTLGELFRALLRHPWEHLGRRWNYKSAVTSSLFRGVLFFFTNLAAGLPAALAALSTEFWFRFIMAGFYGALTQSFRRVDPPRVGTIAALIVLPIVGHGLELLVHWLRGTANLSASIAVSVLFTIIATSFNLFAMRRGALIIGDGSSSLLHDFRRMPALLGAFVLSLFTPLCRRVRPLGRPWAGLKPRPYKIVPSAAPPEVKPERA